MFPLVFPLFLWFFLGFFCFLLIYFISPFLFSLTYGEHAHSGNAKKTDLFPYDFPVHLIPSRVIIGCFNKSFVVCNSETLLLYFRYDEIIFLHFIIFILRYLLLFFPYGVILFCRTEESSVKLEDFSSETGNFLECLGLFETTVLKCGKIHST